VCVCVCEVECEKERENRIHQSRKYSNNNNNNNNNNNSSNNTTATTATATKSSTATINNNNSSNNRCITTTITTTTRGREASLAAMSTSDLATGNSMIQRPECYSTDSDDPPPLLSLTDVESEDSDEPPPLLDSSSDSEEDPLLDAASPPRQLFHSFQRINVVGDHGPHFTICATSYHAHNRCDGAGVTANRIMRGFLPRPIRVVAQAITLNRAFPASPLCEKSPKDFAPPASHSAKAPRKPGKLE
jgi:hypothetical protein